jgi:hypothetical protein
MRSAPDVHVVACSRRHALVPAAAPYTAGTRGRGPELEPEPEPAGLALALRACSCTEAVHWGRLAFRQISLHRGPAGAAARGKVPPESPHCTDVSVSTSPTAMGKLTGPVLQRHSPSCVVPARSSKPTARQLLDAR